jgi:DNA modification methylase
MTARRRTTTSNFGAGARENHDATPFYDRFRAPEVSDADTVLPPRPVEQPFVWGDARRMDAVADGSVALVVTSPPYFAGKQYEEELGRDGIPSSYLEYLDMLADVFAECVRTLEPGGRIAVNVANLGRKPYRSLSADVIGILQHDLGLLLRGELIWQKGDGANGSCAWGSFRSPSNPVLRDISERVIVASKGRFDRARATKQRAAEGLPHLSTLATDDFMALTLDIWQIPPESAKRVGHPAPFPVELPEQLIRLYTFADDLVLDPFMGSGSALVAAARLGRRYIGYDLDSEYVEIARRRVAEALAETESAPAVPLVADGAAADKLAEHTITAAGFTVAARRRRIRSTGVAVSFVARDKTGDDWYFDVAGPLTSHRSGMLRSDVVWKALGRACALRSARGDIPLVLLTSHGPRPGSDCEVAVRAAGPGAVFDVVEMLSAESLERLTRYADGGRSDQPLPGFWRS